ncbi:TPA: hypothetical protein MJB68_23630 [Klebsiella pneumoniae]|uniref:hypothetical protein n=1 Tax=Klebsiella pneumoniae TaxID=573 RepID=UPI00064A8681|nr:hypothetical protein [Klebsiella pneumoniae]AKL32076.1 hypothetical protein AB186_29010 [Klebsiella pneumoniae]ALR28141.1 hypothetical protein AGG09_29305 [Klebsiella pneumoniae]EJI7602844.1 hypothetical protein [Klebsiella pneumoniae]EKX4684869.1 hypothetical protein [Klebsiella pneumoniae]EKZ5670445.1 hypothetical protein [Klebsiella pneumoniae]
MATKNFIQLVDIPDYRFDKRATDIDYDGIACDCDSKTISILNAISHISLNVFSLVEESLVDKEKIADLSCIIADLAELAIATNKISQSASYLSGLKDDNNGA